MGPDSPECVCGLLGAYPVLQRPLGIIRRPETGFIRTMIGAGVVIIELIFGRYADNRLIDLFKIRIMNTNDMCSCPDLGCEKSGFRLGPGS